MAKQTDTRSSTAGAEQTKKRKPRGSSGTSPAKDDAVAKTGRATAQKPGRRKAADDRERRVRDRAYEIWEQEGRPSGREREHWEQAERET